MKHKGLIISILVVITVATVYLCHSYHRLMIGNLHSIDGNKHEINVYPGTSIDSLIEKISEYYIIDAPRTLRDHIKYLKFHNPEPGHYVIPSKCADYDLIQMFRIGQQTPIKITFNNIRTIEQMSSRLSNQLMTDSISFDSMFRDTAFLATYGLNQATAMVFFLPDTYEVYWTITPQRFFERMKAEYEHFWTEHKLRFAAKINLSPIEVSTLASIVEEENISHPQEWRTIAGLYLNRLKIGMPLQADPTVKYAIGDFTISRVLNKHLEVESPYNTYKIKGLPPGPIRVPSRKALDSVLNYSQHSYLYMCADWHMNGYHLFARTSAEHARNARMYQNQLNKRKIYK